MSGHGSKFWGVVLTLGLTGGALTFLVAMMEESRAIDNPTPVFAVLVGGAIFFALLRGPIGKTIARMLEGSGGHDDQLLSRVEQLEDRLAELGMDQVRVAELEERLDFAERLLSQREALGTLKRPEG
jgi:hypothetical protein